MSQHLMFTFELDTKHRVRQGLDHSCNDFNRVFFRQTSYFPPLRPESQFFFDRHRRWRESLSSLLRSAACRRPAGKRRVAGNTAPRDMSLRYMSVTVLAVDPPG